MAKGSNIPSHVAIIMDGNGRWARERGMERTSGHAAGVESVRAMVRGAVRNGIPYLTLYAFSTENWGRPREEVDALMELLCSSIAAEVPELIEQGVAVRMIGGRDQMPSHVMQMMEKAERDTAAGTRLTVMVALNYGSREEIARAARLLAEQVKAGEITSSEITPQTISEKLYTAPCPDPDLLIRTGGEQRLSNFLLWQAAYTELYFTPTMWPDIREEHLTEALAAYADRQRRFGLVDNTQE